jgi:hypothetical protein
LSPGFATVAVKPQVGGLKSGKYSLPTVRGRVTVSFTNTPSRFDLRVSLPASAVGHISVPLSSRTVERARGGDAVHVSVNGVLVQATKIDSGYAVIDVGGGNYRIASDDSLL